MHVYIHLSDKDWFAPGCQVCNAGANFLLEQMTFQLLLTSDLDGGVTMATRIQSKHILTGAKRPNTIYLHSSAVSFLDMIFNELLVKLINTDSTHCN